MSRGENDLTRGYYFALVLHVGREIVTAGNPFEALATILRDCAVLYLLLCSWLQENWHHTICGLDSGSKPPALLYVLSLIQEILLLSEVDKHYTL